ncbi:MAG: choloylglycine hydrolase family protein, partial [Bacteroidaceae bacterium]|nr:choloylglycine hydrolase family protein [Bacteroidaceae bacterium]
MKRTILGLAATIGCSLASMACTGISLTAKDGSYIQARTIEGAQLELESMYVIIPRGHTIESYTPTGERGLKFKAKYGVVGMSVVLEEFIAEGINEAGLSSGLFFFPGYGAYEAYDSLHKDKTLGDLQVNAWILSQFRTIDEVKEAISGVRIVGLEHSSVVHWRIGEPSGRQVVMEIVDGVPHFYENTVGVLTNSPGFEWHLKNLNNYVNLFPGDAAGLNLGKLHIKPFGGNSGFLGLPGDFTPPSRFVRAAFFRATAPQQPTAFETVKQCFHILNNFDIPIGVEHRKGEGPDIPSATQWTSAIDLTNRCVYYKTMHNNTIRRIDLREIDFDKTAYQVHSMD